MVKNFSINVVNLEPPVSLFNLDFNDEIVLTDPTICEVCWDSLPEFPPVKRCPYGYSESEDRGSLEKMKKIVAEWSGNPDPHI